METAEQLTVFTCQKKKNTEEEEEIKVMLGK